MTGPVTIRQGAEGIWIISPDGAPTVLDAEAGIDVAVLEVAGGHLSWSLLAGQSIPAAVIGDLPLAQGWIWAVYGEAIALAVADFDSRAGGLTAEPELPALAANARRLGFALWASRWWPASTIDAIAPLDERLLDREIAALTEECDPIIDGVDTGGWTDTHPTVDVSLRADDYALAAGATAPGGRGALVLARGTCGWDWRRCPPGLVDASERAVSWEVARGSGTTTVRVSVVAAPQLGADVPPHLQPRALVGTAARTVEAELNLVGDSWIGETTAPSASGSGIAVDVYVPGVGPRGRPDLGGPEIRRRVRDLASARLRRANNPDGHAADAPLLAEIAAAASDSDF